ncbi:putative transcription factor C2H2 family [Helianthus annuus]|nr:putative transcription factor C2H2 family [Helianthus annuus]
MEEEEEMIETKREFPIFRDIRRYTCAYCGIVRSKKTLITTHILQSHHQVCIYVCISFLQLYTNWKFFFCTKCVLIWIAVLC